MHRIFIAIIIIYPIVAAIGGAATLLVTLWAYNADTRMVSDTVTAATINTAAVVAALGFFGGLEMILSIWQFMRNHDAEQARQQERLEDKARWEQERQEERERREQERVQRDQERQEERERRGQERARQEQERELLEQERREDRVRREQERVQREQERVQREQERARQEQERELREQERVAAQQAMLTMQSEFLAQLRAEGERNAALTARVMALSELAIHRANGNGNGVSDAGAAVADEPVPQASVSQPT